MPFFEYRQNNSGGRFLTTSDLGVNVVVEAVDSDDANRRAQRLGIYFDGVERELDCSCCGDRWIPVVGQNGTEIPCVYNVPVPLGAIEELMNVNESGSSLRNDKIIVHRIDGIRETWVGLSLSVDRSDASS